MRPSGFWASISRAAWHITPVTLCSPGRSSMAPVRGGIGKEQPKQKRAARVYWRCPLSDQREQARTFCVKEQLFDMWPHLSQFLQVTILFAVWYRWVALPDDLLLYIWASMSFVTDEPIYTIFSFCKSELPLSQIISS